MCEDMSQSDIYKKLTPTPNCRPFLSMLEQDWCLPEMDWLCSKVLTCLCSSRLPQFNTVCTLESRNRGENTQTRTVVLRTVKRSRNGVILISRTRPFITKTSKTEPGHQVNIAFSSSMVINVQAENSIQLWSL